MKKRITILGSTGSIGTTTLKIIDYKKQLFEVDTLIANSNYKKILQQILKFKPRNFIISDVRTYSKIKKKFKNKKTNIFNHYKDIKKKIKKNDIVVAAIPGIAGLEATLHYTAKTKKILLANKESIICGWNIIKKVSKANKTRIIPLDSEHFSITKLVDDKNNNEVEKIYITASGGPFLNLPKSKFKNIKPIQAIKHPKWKMGNKISVDSATLMNKILELLEAQKLFKFDINKYKIIIHPQSLVHAIIKFKNGISKLLYHEPDMLIPISNAIFDKKLDLNNLTKNEFNKENTIKNLEFKKVDKDRFRVIKLIPKLNEYVSTPIVINAANEILVDQFLKKKISFSSIIQYLFLVLKDKNYKKYAIYRPTNLKNIYMIDHWSRKTTLSIIKKKKRT
jgi:1-deoxy-D-xylulose-5-phosphate reductoisomerase